MHENLACKTFRKAGVFALPGWRNFRAGTLTGEHSSGNSLSEDVWNCGMLQPRPSLGQFNPVRRRMELYLPQARWSSALAGVPRYMMAPHWNALRASASRSVVDRGVTVYTWSAQSGRGVHSRQGPRVSSSTYCKGSGRCRPRWRSRRRIFSGPSFRVDPDHAVPPQPRQAVSIRADLYVLPRMAPEREQASVDLQVCRFGRHQTDVAAANFEAAGRRMQTRSGSLIWVIVHMPTRTAPPVSLRYSVAFADGLPGIEFDMAHNLDAETRIDRRLHHDTAFADNRIDVPRSKATGGGQSRP